jgi:hypothetical protein
VAVDGTLTVSGGERGADRKDPEAAKAAVGVAMGSYLQSPDLRFLMELSIEPVATKLGLIEPGS